MQRLLRNCALLVAVGALNPMEARADEALFAAFGSAEPPFAQDEELCGTGAGAGYVGYLGAERRCADILIDSLQDAAGIADGTAGDIVLLASRPDGQTLYRVSGLRQPILLLQDIQRTATPLTIRGQRGRDGSPLIWFKGLDLIDTLCDPARVRDEAACRAGAVGAAAEAPAEPWAGRYELGSLALVEEAMAVRAASADLAEHSGVTTLGPQAYCVVLRRVAGIVLADLGFEDCWLVGVLAVDSREVTLRDSLLHGSTFGFLALATSKGTASSHSFVIAGNRWLQTPAAYRPDPAPCARPHLDLSCAPDLWSELPWGVVHHHLWRPLNGALFAGYEIAGNVLFADNEIERAFNGIRLWSQVAGSGRNVEIRGNRFRYIRDNPIEPEGRAEGWIVKHNTFDNAHAWISTDGVAGGALYIFGNRGWHDAGAIPGQRCREDVDWALSPQFAGLAGEGGRWRAVDESGDPAAVECLGHLRGVVLKTGDDGRRGFPYLASIAIFNNSWTTRWPLFSSKHASPLVHFNNLVAFAGCGLEGPLDCRQIPFPEDFCGAGDPRTRGGAVLGQLWTDDASTLVADCFSLTPGPAEPDPRAGESYEASHRFCRDAYNRRFEGLPYGEGDCAPLFVAGFVDLVRGAPSLAAPLTGCRPVLLEEAVLPDCSGVGPALGAVDDEGRLFDLAIPGAGYLGADFQP